MSGDQDTGTSGNRENRESGNPEKDPKLAGFEKLWVWELAHQLMLEMHKTCKSLPYQEKFRISNQLERSSSSVADNIAEGYTSYYYQEKIKGFFVARKEAGETQNHIRSLLGKGYIKSIEARHFIEEYERVIRGINGYVNWVRKKAGYKK
jgi:four helix bundle protein